MHLYLNYINETNIIIINNCVIHSFYLSYPLNMKFYISNVMVILINYYSNLGDIIFFLYKINVLVRIIANKYQI